MTNVSRCFSAVSFISDVITTYHCLVLAAVKGCLVGKWLVGNECTLISRTFQSTSVSRA